MLPAESRLRRSVDILETIKRGRRLSERHVVLHVVAGGDPTRAAQFAFAVGKNVGNSVIRHRTTRRLRHIVRDVATVVPGGSRIVVRALPGSAEADTVQLRAAVTAALAKGGWA